jgi:PIN domain nuclease of toxin-antitoxin system
MRLLVDTHILIWFLEGNSSLTQPRQQLIIDSDNDIFVSIACLWEIAIKISTGKLNLSLSMKEIVDYLGKENFKILSITSEHIIEIEKLPFYHKDPFDRILIAQAKVESLALITDDKHMKLYNVKTYS